MSGSTTTDYDWAAMVKEEEGKRKPPVIYEFSCGKKFTEDSGGDAEVLP